MAWTLPLKEALAVRELSSDEFTTIHNPFQAVYLLPYAYGGCVIGSAIIAAYQTTQPGYHLYTVFGHFLSPTFTDQPLFISITRLRDTRTFATRLIQISQSQLKGIRRMVATMTINFHRAETGTLLTMSTPPSAPLGAYPPPSECIITQENHKQMVKAGKITAEQASAFDTSHAPALAHFEERDCPDSISLHTLRLSHPEQTTPQDSLPLHERTSANYFRAFETPSTEGEHLAILGYYLDHLLVAIAAGHERVDPTTVGTLTTLDFAMRVFVNDVDVTKWLLREMKAVAAGEGRTYAETRLWDENGRMVANMTEQTMLRPAKRKGKL